MEQAGTMTERAHHPIRLVVTDDLQRNRLTSFFRLILAIPHLVWLALWSIVAVLAAVANWVATLVNGKSPEGLVAVAAYGVVAHADIHERPYRSRIVGLIERAETGIQAVDGEAGRQLMGSSFVDSSRAEKADKTARG